MPTFMPTLRFSLLSLALLSSCTTASAPAEPKPSPKQLPRTAPPETRPSRVQGWDYLALKLVEAGLPRSTVSAVYGDPKMPPMEFISFRLAPKEPSNIYRGFTNPKKVNEARSFLVEHEQVLKRAEAKFGTAKEGIVSILLVETHFGENTGNHLLLNRLSRLANLRDPKNVRKNYEELKKLDDTVTYEAVEKRADYLWTTFFPEVLAVFKIAEERKVSVFSIRGSSAGAFGFPQFLPTSYLRFGTDGNGNGNISLFEMDDAIFSVAKYLSHHGWKKGATQKQKWQAVWAYNHSDPYIEAVLKVTELLQ